MEREKDRRGRKRKKKKEIFNMKRGKIKKWEKIRYGIHQRENQKEHI